MANNPRERSKLSVSVGSGNKTGKTKETGGAKWCSESANGRNWYPEARKSGNTFKNKPGAK